MVTSGERNRHAFTTVARNDAGLRWLRSRLTTGYDAKDALDRTATSQGVLDRSAPTAMRDFRSSAQSEDACRLCPHFVVNRIGRSLSA
jgi:hypothetical protein